MKLLSNKQIKADRARLMEEVELLKHKLERRRRNR